MGKSKIEWTDYTFNPVWGCVKVSPACDNCYAEAFDKRLGGKHWGPHAPRRTFGDKHWAEPLKWDRAAEKAGARKRVFCASMADVFDNAWPDDVRPRLWQLIVATPNLDWLLLTKRPQNISGMLPRDWGKGYENVWLGVTAEHQQEADRRIPLLLKIPARIRFVSYEPALGPVNFEPFLQYPPMTEGYKMTFGSAEWRGIDWVICGGESGHSARPMSPDWARAVRDECAAAGVAFHFKQWGEHKPITRTDGIHESPFGGHAMVGKAKAGRLLDGRTHDGYPA